METYDIVMLAVIAAAVIFGAWKGLAWQIASLAAIFLSYFVALNFREPVADLINTAEPWNKFLAMFILFVGTSLGVWIVFGIVSKQIEKMQLKSFDRQAGAAVGAIKGAILCLVVTFFALTLLGENQKHAICKSTSGKYIAQFIDSADAIIPKEVHKVVQPYLEKMDKALDHDHPENPEIDDLDPARTLNGLMGQPNVANQTGIGGQQAGVGNQVQVSGSKGVSINGDGNIEVDWREIDWKRVGEAVIGNGDQNR